MYFSSVNCMMTNEKYTVPFINYKFWTEDLDEFNNIASL